MAAAPVFNGKTGSLNEIVMPGPTRCVAVRYEYADGTGVPYVEFMVRKEGDSTIIAFGTTDEYGNGLATGLPPDAERVVVEFDGDPEPYREFQPRIEIPWPPPEPEIQIPYFMNWGKIWRTYGDWLTAPFVFEMHMLYGAIVGDISKNPSFGQILGNVVIGFVPYAGQVADARDIIANIYWLYDDPKDVGAWIGLTTSIISVIPGAGDAVKGIVKVVYKTAVNEVTRKTLFKVLNTFGQGSGAKYLDEVADKLVDPMGRDAVDLAKRIINKMIESLKELRNSKFFPESFGPELDVTIKKLESICEQAEGQMIGILTECQNKVKTVLGREKGMHVKGSGPTISDDVAASVKEDWRKEIEARAAKSEEIRKIDPFESARKSGVNSDWIKDAERRLANSNARSEMAGDAFHNQIIVRQEQLALEKIRLRGSLGGMAAHHLGNLEKVTADKELLVIVRTTKTAAMRFFGWKNMVPKPVDVKLKSAKTGYYKGLVVRPDNFDAKHEYWNNWLELEKKKYRFNKKGVLLNPEGKAIYADYDLQGVYARQGNSNIYKSVDTNNPAFLGDLNDKVCGGEPMFKHGANDDYIVRGASGKQIPGRQIELKEEFLVVENGVSHVIESVDDLKKFYNEKQIPWIYTKQHGIRIEGVFGIAPPTLWDDAKEEAE